MTEFGVSAAAGYAAVGVMVGALWVASLRLSLWLHLAGRWHGPAAALNVGRIAAAVGMVVLGVAQGPLPLFAALAGFIAVPVGIMAAGNRRARRKTESDPVC